MKEAYTRPSGPEHFLAEEKQPGNHQVGSTPLCEPKLFLQTDRARQLAPVPQTLEASLAGEEWQRRRERGEQWRWQEGKRDTDGSKSLAELVKERLTDRYPDGWQVYDTDGRRIWKINLMDKALLARWRRFESLPPEDQLRELREWTETHVQTEESAGEKTAEVVAAIFALIFGLISTYLDGRGDEAAHQPAQFHLSPLIVFGRESGNQS